MRSLARVQVAAEMQLRELLRRRLALLILIALPLVFYSSTLSSLSFALVAGTIGMSWSVASAGLFSVLSSRNVEPRLVLGGFKAAELLLGRLLLLLGFGLLLATAFGILMPLASSPKHLAPLLVAVYLVALISVPLGLAVATLIPRELEGTLVIIGVVGVEMSLPPNSALGIYLPLYGPLELAYQAAGLNDDAIWRLGLHGVVYGAALMALAVGLWTRRMRVRRSVPSGTGSSAPTQTVGTTE